MTLARDHSTDGSEFPAPPERGEGDTIHICDGALARRAVLVDIAEDQALIDAGEWYLPQRLVLVHPRTGLSYLAAVIWRQDTRIRIRFLGEGPRYRVLRSPGDLHVNHKRRAS